ncbi:MAG TPA: replication protein RepA [Gemmatimonadales bacterium]|nr:replication protein RepA [Gemmatimonadales bacterium]
MSDDRKDDDKPEEGLRPILELLPPLPPRPKPNYPHLGRLDEFVSTDDDPTGIVYQHSVLCQTFLPYRDAGPDVRTWTRSNGFLNLQVTAGDAVDPATGQFVPVGLPFGPKARLVLYHLNAEALRTRSPVIELAASLTKFVRHTLALSSDGRTIALVKDQLTRLAAADFRVLMRAGNDAHVLKGTFIERFSLWAPRDSTARDRSPTKVYLSRPYFESLLSRAVPLNESAVWCLSHNALAMDIYAWLAQRLHRIDPDKGEVLVPWPRLHEQFGSAYTRLRKFREVLGPTLAQVSALYPQAKVGLDRRGMTLRHSRPPVAKKRFLLATPE